MIPLPEFKTCGNCGVEQPCDIHHFASNGGKGTPYSARRMCRRCQSRAAVERQQRLLSDPATADAFRLRRNATVRNWSDRHRDRKHATEKRWRDRMTADPERYEAHKARLRAYYAANAELREKRRRYMRAYYWRMKRLLTQGWTDEPDYEPPTTSNRVPSEPFRALLAEMFPHADALEVAALLGWDSAHARRVIAGEYDRICLHVVDRLLTEGLGRPDLLDVLYPLEGVES